jgi:hypothetical protein
MRHYKVVEADSRDQLERFVNHLLEYRWGLQGGISVTELGGNFRFYQAMMGNE